jgi:hypothetical protein
LLLGSIHRQRMEATNNNDNADTPVPGASPTMYSPTIYSPGTGGYPSKMGFDVDNDRIKIAREVLECKMKAHATRDSNSEKTRAARVSDNEIARANNEKAHAARVSDNEKAHAARVSDNEMVYAARVSDNEILHANNEKAYAARVSDSEMRHAAALSDIETFESTANAVCEDEEKKHLAKDQELLDRH